MKRPYKEESIRWFMQAKDEFEDILTRYPNALPGGVPSQYFDDPKEAEEAMQLAKSVIDLVEIKIRKAQS